MAKTKSEILPGAAYPLGATFDGKGTNFALFSEHATGAELCLFGGALGNDEIARVPLVERTEHIWHAYLAGVGAGQRYGYRVSGPYDPPKGHRYNPAKLLLDPYARAIDRAPQLGRFDVRVSREQRDRSVAQKFARQRARDAQVRGGRFRV